MEIYIALQPSYAPPTFLGIHCLYMLTQEQIDLDMIDLYVQNKHPVQIVVNNTNNAMHILQHICPNFSTKNLHIHCK